MVWITVVDRLRSVGWPSFLVLALPLTLKLDLALVKGLMWATLMPSSMIRHLLRAHLVCSQSYSPSSYRTLPSPFLQARGLHTSTKSSVLPPIRATLEEIRVILRDIDVDVSCASIEDEIRYLTVKLEVSRYKSPLRYISLSSDDRTNKFG